jgi:beta-glucosidase/6-phospho-beta-glucosidase/beta-galactosidase
MTDWFAQYDADLPVISTPLDFLGVNYYCPQTVAAPDGPIADPSKPSTTPGSENLVAVDTGLERTQMGWPIQPSSLRDLLKTINELAPDLPLYVTENGAAYQTWSPPTPESKTPNASAIWSSTSTSAARSSMKACP